MKEYICYYYRPYEVSRSDVENTYKHLQKIFDVPVICLPFTSCLQTLESEQLAQIRNMIDRILSFERT